LEEHVQVCDFVKENFGQPNSGKRPGPPHLITSFLLAAQKQFKYVHVLVNPFA